MPSSPLSTLLLGFQPLRLRGRWAVASSRLDGEDVIVLVGDDGPIEARDVAGSSAAAAPIARLASCMATGSCVTKVRAKFTRYQRAGWPSVPMLRSSAPRLALSRAISQISISSRQGSWCRTPARPSPTKAASTARLAAVLCFASGRLTPALSKTAKRPAIMNSRPRRPAVRCCSPCMWKGPRSLRRRTALGPLDRE